MRAFLRCSLLALILVSFAIYGNEDKKCKDEKLAHLVEENCALIRKITGNEDGCRAYVEILKVCATSSLNDEQLKTLRDSVEQTNSSLREAMKNDQEIQQANENQLRDDFTHLKKACRNSNLNSALDDYVRYSKNYANAIDYLKICRNEKLDNFYSNHLAQQIRSGLRQIRFKENKPPDLRPYIAQCKDAAIKNAAEATLAELTVLKYREVEPVLVSGGHAELEQILFKLELHTKSENLEKLEQLRKWFIAIQEVQARKKLLNSR